ncbi:hypothetical protein PN437_06100 [Microcystis aeruginosa CS-564/01]|nr:hypothetical protein [Microcystis aeruginosa CS-564/01]
MSVSGRLDIDFFRFSRPLYRLVISYQLSVISYQLSVISYQLSVIKSSHLLVFSHSVTAFLIIDEV